MKAPGKEELEKTKTNTSKQTNKKSRCVYAKDKPGGGERSRETKTQQVKAKKDAEGEGRALWLQKEVCLG